MSLLVVGLSHRSAPIAVLERATVPCAEVGKVLCELLDCDHVAEAFRSWLQRRYGDLPTLNAAWTTAFWSQGYSAWEQVFPGVVQPSSAIPAQLEAHFRYPEDLFKVQRQLLTTYHVNNPQDFYSSKGFWSVPNDPTTNAVLYP